MARAFQQVPPLSMASVATQTEAHLFGGPRFERERRTASESTALWSSWSQVDRPMSRLIPMEMTDPYRRSSGGHNDETCITTYEEITLHRVQKEVKFGMTLWYQTGNVVSSQHQTEDEARRRTEVYIGEIDPGGIAARDGRARVGDRILEINGMRVESRETVVQLLRSDCPYIRLLVSRMRSPSVQSDDGFADDLDVLECLSFRDETGQCVMPLECIDEEDDNATDDTNENERQDSGLGKTDESTRNEESSEQEAADDSVLSPQSEDSSVHQRSNESFASTEGGQDGEESDGADDHGPSIIQCQQFYEMLKQRCNAVRDAHQSPPSASSSSDRDLGAASPEGDYARLRGPGGWDAVEMTMALIADDLSNLRLESSSYVQLEEWTGIPVSAARKVPRMGTRVEFARQGQQQCIVEKAASVPPPASWMIQEPVSVSHSPVRPSHSQRMDPLGNPEGPPFQRFIHAGSHCVPPSSAGHSTKLRSDCVVVSAATADYDLTRLQQQPSSDPPLKVVRTSQMCQTDDEGEYESLVPFASNRFPGPIVPCRCRRCTHQPPANPSPSVQSQHADARSFSETMSGDVQTTNIQAAVPGAASTTESNAGVGQQHEWVVKRRADGSRYITRRPVRKRLLKERARRVEEERACLTTTTEEDRTTYTSRPLDQQRQGTRDDRRRHAERSRTRRRERETAAASRDRTGGHGSGTTRQGWVDDNEEPNIVQLSRKKMLKCKGKRVLDDFTTLQELLAHGSRDPHQGRAFNHLLSVTTV